jgi:hypothetical protein
MCDYSDNKENDQSPLIIPPDTTGKNRLIKNLLSWRFYLSMALSLSLFINGILIVRFCL